MISFSVNSNFDLSSSTFYLGFSFNSGNLGDSFSSSS